MADSRESMKITGIFMKCLNMNKQILCLHVSITVANFAVGLENHNLNILNLICNQSC